jgi:hypothetical protein
VFCLMMHYVVDNTDYRASIENDTTSRCEVLLLMHRYHCDSGAPSFCSLVHCKCECTGTRCPMRCPTMKIWEIYVQCAFLYTVSVHWITIVAPLLNFINCYVSGAVS